MLRFIEDSLQGASVEWRTLGEVFETRNGYTPSKKEEKYWRGGTIPWFRMEDLRTSGTLLSTAIQRITPEAIRGKGLFRANSIIMATTATIGEHALLLVDALANQRFTNFRIRETYEKCLLPKFAYYYFYILDAWCLENTYIGSFPSVDVEKLKLQKFPIPPFHIQEKIVAVLDKFTALERKLETKLGTELVLRQKQYEYYRNKLLTFGDEVERKRLGNIVAIKRGKRLVKKELETSGNFAVFQNSIKPLGFYSASNVNADTTFAICAGSAGEIGYSHHPFWAADDVCYFIPNDTLRSKFLYYILLNQQNTIKSQVRRAIIPRLPRTVLEDFIIPIPPLHVQEKIVEILDKFNTLTNSITEELPREIALRHQQYEYYRDQLLTFPKN